MPDAAANQHVLQMGFPPGFGIAEVNYAPNLAQPPHDHGDARLILTLRGSFEEHIGRNAYSCGPLSVLFRPAGESHTDRYSAAGARCLSIRFDHGWSQLLPKVVAGPACSRSPEFSPLIARIDREFRIPAAVSAIAVQCSVLDILTRISPRQKHRHEAREPRCVQWTKDILHSRMQGPLDVLGVAAQVGLHPAHLSRTFKQWTGVTLSGYLRKLRLHQACDQLKNSTKSLATIALDSGFYDQAHFSRVFRQHIGVAPKDFRATWSKFARSVQDRQPADC